MSRWYRLAERYVVAWETYTAGVAACQNAQTRLADSNRVRNEHLRDLDERRSHLDERAAVTDALRTTTLETLGKFMGGIIERLTRIETNMGSPVLPGEEEKT